MSLHRRNPKRDQAERQIIADLLRCGCTVQQLSGKDIPDLLVGYQGENHLLEVKSDQKTHHQKNGGVKKGQIDWAAEWKGKKPRLARTTEEALRAIGAIK